MYPSISICKKYAFDNNHINFFDNKKKTIDNAVRWIQRYSWDLEWVVYFFTQPGVLNKTFPCTTTLGGMTPGRPCVFPILWGSELKYSCFLMNTPRPACLTKIKLNDNNYDLFGYCNQNCSGEMQGQNLQKLMQSLFTFIARSLQSLQSGFEELY